MEDILNYAPVPEGCNGTIMKHKEDMNNFEAHVKDARGASDLLYLERRPALPLLFKSSNALLLLTNDALRGLTRKLRT